MSLKFAKVMATVTDLDEAEEMEARARKPETTNEGARTQRFFIVKQKIDDDVDEFLRES